MYGTDKASLMMMHPKGCKRPISDGYNDVAGWMEAQSAWGLKQLQCSCHGLWLFPQERDGHKGPWLTYEQFKRQQGKRMRGEDQVVGDHEN